MTFNIREMTPSESKCRLLLKYLSSFNSLDIMSNKHSLKTMKKCVMNTQTIALSSQIVKVSGSSIRPKVFLSSYIINNFPREVLDHHEVENSLDQEIYLKSKELTNCTKKLCLLALDLEELDNNKFPLNKVQSKLEEFKNKLDDYESFYNIWEKKDKDQYVEFLVKAYYALEDTLNDLINDKTVPENVLQEYQLNTTKQQGKLRQQLRILNSIDKLDRKNIKPEPITEMTVSEDLYQHVKRTVETAFWDKIEEDINNGLFDHVSKLLEEINKIFVENPNISDIKLLKIPETLDIFVCSQLVQDNLKILQELSKSNFEESVEIENHLNNLEMVIMSNKPDKLKKELLETLKFIYSKLESLDLLKKE